MMIASLAFLTDVADGGLARRWGIASDRGAILDGLGDKAFYVSVYLVIQEYNAEQTLVLWLLIFREIALYGLRIVDKRRETTTKRLRWISLAFALLIRLYFITFFSRGALHMWGFSTPRVFAFSYLLAYAAALLGLVGLVIMARGLSEKLER
jgi:phosphatidylglycerophosphate synthase